MTETLGVLIAVLSSTFGGTSGAVTRYVVGILDPVTIAAFRFGVGVLVLAPIALVTRSALPRGRDWLGVAALGVMFFGVFFVFYNLALSYTTAARGALALSTLPLWTMVVAALLGAEPLTGRKTLGVCIAVGGVAIALTAGLSVAPARQRAAGHQRKGRQHKDADAEAKRRDRHRIEDTDDIAGHRAGRSAEGRGQHRDEDADRFGQRPAADPRGRGGHCLGAHCLAPRPSR